MSKTKGADLKLRPIRSSRDHREALAQVERLCGASPGTPEGTTLDALATLIVAYEHERFPVDPPSKIRKGGIQKTKKTNV